MPQDRGKCTMLNVLSVIGWHSILLMPLAGEEQPRDSMRSSQAAPATRVEQAEPPADVEQVRNLSGGEQKLLDWFDTLGFPNVATAPFGRVLGATSVYAAGKEFQRETSLGYGFLLSEDDAKFKILALDLWPQTHTKAQKHDRVGATRFEVVDLKETVPELLERLKGPRDDRKRTADRWFGRQTLERPEVLLLARACAAQGHTALAHELLVFLATRADPETRQIPVGNELRSGLADEISRTGIWQNFLAIGSPEISRAELLRRFRHYSNAFPGAPYGSRAREIELVLERMVKEDDAHIKPPALDVLNTHDRVAELIFRLRDAQGHQFSDPGRCIFTFDSFELWGLGTGPDREPSAGQQLIDLGFDAVPQLIAHLNDDRLTRAVGCHRSSHFSHYPLRVGDCVRAILERIADRTFYRRKSTSSEMMLDGDVEEVRAAVEAWWIVAQKEGEKQLLIEGVMKLERRAPDMARRLLVKYPDAVVDTVRAATGKSSDQLWTICGLLRVVGQVSDDNATQLLLDKMTNDKDLPVRTTAAEELLKRKHSQAVPALIREWQQLLRAAAQDQALWSSIQSGACDDLIRLLVRSASADAIRAISPALDQLQTETRLGVLYSFAARKDHFEPPVARRRWMHESDEPITLVGEQAVAVEELLIKSLDDPAQSEDFPDNWDDKQIECLRVCDVGALVLTDRWGESYKFNPGVPVAQRNRQLILMKNVWRNKRKLTPLPVPE